MTSDLSPGRDEARNRSFRKGRAEMEADEDAQLAPYAVRSAASAGRRHREPSHAYRTEFQRDRARIIHSRAFRRLEYKTQVFLNGTGDHLRTRLTHTIEVASISRTMARALGLNEDLAESIALAHDLGHAPFGHPGERTLDRCMREHGGFDHNAQSLRTVELIERSYPQFPGLNLSFEVTEGLRKHEERYESWNDPSAEAVYANPSLEAQIANLADEIAYNSHDLDDGLGSALISVEQLSALDLWQEVSGEVQARHPSLSGHARSAAVIRRLIDVQVEDALATSAANLAAADVRTVMDVRRHAGPLISHSPDRLPQNAELRRFLFAHLYDHPTVAAANERACARLADVFAAYLRSPEQLGVASVARIEEHGLHRTVCDYIAGMTDRYLLEAHARLFGSASGNAHEL